MKIVRKENGNILLTDASGNTIKRLPEYAVLELKKDTEGEFVRVAYGHQNKHDIYVDQITHTQLEPAAEVAFSGTGQDLLNLLSTSFFFEVSGGVSTVEYPTGEYLDFLPVHNARSQQSFNNTDFLGSVVRIYSDVEIDSSYAWIQAASSGGGIIGIYKYDDDTADLNLVASIDGLDLSVTGTQFLNYPSNIKLEAGIYVTGFNLQNVTTMGSFSYLNMEPIFGFGSLNVVNAYKNRVTFPKVYDGTLPLVVNSATYSLIASANVNPATYHRTA